jgi:carboxypeptidase Taq
MKQAIAKQKNQPTIFPEGNFSIEKQKALGLKLAETIGFDFNHGRLDVSHHPFCGGVPNDVRMTTRYNTKEFITAAMGVCHETGHARYEQNLPKQWIHQPVGSALGMMIHESQSLLIEMQVCRSVEFMQFLSPLMIEQFGDNKAFSSDNLYQLYTHVKPGYIRVDADEITYPLHIILRYELEKALIEGDMKASELPDAWDEKMMQYLGLSTKNNFAEGVMQDVHWPCGAFGYFPAYTLGRLAAAQFFAAIKRDVPFVLNDIASGNFTPLYEWLIHHIFSKASSVMPETLIKEATGEYLDEKYFIGHVQERYCV